MTIAKNPRSNFPKALKFARSRMGLSQESFALVSSRTYVSTLERAIQSPTISKVDSLAQVMEIHPMTLFALSYLSSPSGDHPDELLERVSKEISMLQAR